MQSRFRRLWEALRLNSEPIKLISGFAVGVFVLIQYLDAQTTKRISRALEYVKAYNANEMLEARFNNDPSILYVTDEGYVLQQLREQREPQRDGVTELPLTLPNKDSTNNEEAESIPLSVEQLQYMTALKNFYRPVSYCAFSRLCDPDVVCKNFFLDVQNFSERYPEIFNELGEDWVQSELYFMTRFLEFCQSDPQFLTVAK
jgi:hypothetical protein